MSKPKKTLKAIPEFKTEAEEREFWATADSTEYVDWSSAQLVRSPKLPPTVQSLLGVLAGKHVSEEDYYRHLEDKHR